MCAQIQSIGPRLILPFRKGKALAEDVSGSIRKCSNGPAQIADKADLDFGTLFGDNSTVIVVLSVSQSVSQPDTRYQVDLFFDAAWGWPEEHSTHSHKQKKVHRLGVLVIFVYRHCKL